MEHPCHKCAQPVADGVPFCTRCGAPQIRVTIPEPPPTPVHFGDEATPFPAPVVLPSSQNAPVMFLSMQWSQVLRPCALAGLIAVLLMSLGLNPFVAMLAAGILAVAFYRRRNPGITVKAAAGARLGALSGLLWFGISAVLEALLVAVLHKGPGLRSEMINKIQQASSRTNDPQVLAMFDRLKTPEGLVFMMLFGLIFLFLTAIVLAAIGGALGGAFLGRRDRS